jgi:hypothetical protein
MKLAQTILLVTVACSTHKPETPKQEEVPLTELSNLRHELRCNRKLVSISANQTSLFVLTRAYERGEVLDHYELSDTSKFSAPIVLIESRCK